MFDGNGLLSTGTAFFYCVGEEWFLVTNWHNVTGRHFLSKTPLSGNRFPTYIEASLSSFSRGRELQPDRAGVFAIGKVRIDLYSDHRPVWYEHPAIGSQCDLVAIPFERPVDCPDFMHNAANLISKDRIPILPGTVVFIIGFPRSLSVGFGLPIWKSGYIASEPHYNVRIGDKLSPTGMRMRGTELPAFFVDVQSREGMSGSPIFARHFSDVDMSNPYAPINESEPNFWSRDDVVLFGETTQFIGCYSARIGGQEEGAALGLCWTELAIAQVCQGRRLGPNPHISVCS